MDGWEGIKVDTMNQKLRAGNLKKLEEEEERALCHFLPDLSVRYLG